MSIAITGNPGVGKHTIAKNLSKILDFEIIDISKIAIDEGIFVKSDEALDVDVVHLKKILKSKITKKLLVVGHLVPYTLTKSAVELVIVLRRNPYKLLNVYKERKYSKNKAIENVSSEILGIIMHDAIKKFGKKKVYQVDTTSKTSSMVTKEIQNILHGKVKEERIDWLKIVSEKNDLKKFFPY